MNVRDVGLRQPKRELGQPRRRFEEDGQDAGGQGIERAGVSDSMGAGQPAQTADDGK